MKINLNIVIFISLITLFTSCKYFSFKAGNTDGDVIAKVGDKKLYSSEIKSLFSENGSISKDDSLKIVNSYIENWARRQIILQKATYNLTEEQQLSFDEMVKRYKEDLLINNYKEALVSQKIDSVLTDDEIRKFYDANNQIFTLNKDLLQYRLLSYAANSKQAQAMKDLFRKNDSVSVNKLMTGDYVYQTLNLNDSLWTEYKDFIEKYPFLQSMSKDNLMQPNQFFETKDNNIVYYFQIKSVMRSGDISPLQFVTSDVSKMILHQKKLKYLQDLETTLIQEAIQNKTYEKY